MRECYCCSASLCGAAARPRFAYAFGRTFLFCFRAGVARVLPQRWNRMGQVECVDARHVSSDGSLSVCCGSLRVESHGRDRSAPQLDSSTAAIRSVFRRRGTAAVDSLGGASIPRGTCGQVCGRDDHTGGQRQKRARHRVPNRGRRQCARVSTHSVQPTVYQHGEALYRCTAPARVVCCTVAWHGIAALLPGVQASNAPPAHRSVSRRQAARRCALAAS